MHFLWMLIIGLIVGAIAKFVMPGKDPGGILITCSCSYHVDEANPPVEQHQCRQLSSPPLGGLELEIQDTLSCRHDAG